MEGGGRWKEVEGGGVAGKWRMEEQEKGERRGVEAGGICQEEVPQLSWRWGGLGVGCLHFARDNSNHKKLQKCPVFQSCHEISMSAGVTASMSAGVTANMSAGVTASMSAGVTAHDSKP